MTDANDIRVTGPDGRPFSFPLGTTEAEIDEIMQSHYAPPDPYGRHIAEVGGFKIYSPTEISSPNQFNFDAGRVIINGLRDLGVG